MDTMDDRELYLTDTKISGDDVHSEEPRYPPDAIPNPKGTNKSSYAIYKNLTSLLSYLVIRFG
jgi:hypothetical protein